MNNTRKFSWFVFIGALLVLATGCGAAARAPRTPNASLAFDATTHSCVAYRNGATSDDYNACVAMVGETPAPVAAKTPDTTDDAPSTTETPAPVASPIPVAPPTLYAIPTGSGPVCEAPPGAAVNVNNNSDYYIEMQSSDITYLNCDMLRSTVSAKVALPGGGFRWARFIPPHRSARMVRVYMMNGSMAQAPANMFIEVVSYTNLGMSVAPPPNGHKTITWASTNLLLSKNVNVTLLNGDFGGI